MHSKEVEYINLIDHTALGEDDLSPYTMQVPVSSIDDTILSMSHEVSAQIPPWSLYLLFPLFCLTMAVNVSNIKFKLYKV